MKHKVYSESQEQVVRPTIHILHHTTSDKKNHSKPTVVQVKATIANTWSIASLIVVFCKVGHV